MSKRTANTKGIMVNSTECDQEKHEVSLEKMRKDSEAHAINRIWFLEHLPRLREKYLNKWVAVDSDDVVDSDKDFEKLLRRLSGRLPNMSAIEIEFVSSEDFELVLPG